jgi:hypothetical protein
LNALPHPFAPFSSLAPESAHRYDSPIALTREVPDGFGANQDGFNNWIL